MQSTPFYSADAIIRDLRDNGGWERVKEDLRRRFEGKSIVELQIERTGMELFPVEHMGSIFHFWPAFKLLGQSHPIEECVARSSHPVEDATSKASAAIEALERRVSELESEVSWLKMRSDE